jgi:hypothetical protein
MELASLVVTILSIGLLYGIPLAVIAAVLYGAYRSFMPAGRKLPGDLPGDLFDDKPADPAAAEADAVATSEFKKSFGAKARKRFAAVLCRFNAYFFIQKKY